MVAQAAPRDSREALTYTFNTSDRVTATAEHAGFVHESGRALLEIGLPWLDSRKAAFVIREK